MAGGRPLATLSGMGRGTSYALKLIALVAVLSLGVGYVGIRLVIVDTSMLTEVLGTGLLLLGIAGVVAAGYGISQYSGATTLWIFEAGVLAHHEGRSLACRWEDIKDFEASGETGRRRFWLRLTPDTRISLSADDSAQVMPVMEYVEVRVSSTQLLKRLRSIWHGGRERFGVIELGRDGLQGPGFFAPWPEVRRVVSHSSQLFVDCSRLREWAPIRYRDVSFPFLMMAIAHILIEEHGRLPSADAPAAAAG